MAFHQCIILYNMYSNALYTNQKFNILSLSFSCLLPFFRKTMENSGLIFRSLLIIDHMGVNLPTHIGRLLLKCTFHIKNHELKYYYIFHT